MDEMIEILKQAIEIARTKPQAALDLLRAGLDQARRRGDTRGLAILARHTAVISTEAGDFLGAIQYYDEALSVDPEDAYLHFARGDIFRALGKDEQARTAFKRSLALATNQGDADMIKMVTQARSGFDRRER
jgi:tetratricopeptide (TPR) repeat protein